MHRWHVDVETRRWRGISAFVAMTGTTPGYSGLKFLNGSHALPESPQDRRISTDDDALRWAKSAVAWHPHKPPCLPISHQGAPSIVIPSGVEGKPLSAPR